MLVQHDSLVAGPEFATGVALHERVRSIVLMPPYCARKVEDAKPEKKTHSRS